MQFLYQNSHIELSKEEVAALWKAFMEAGAPAAIRNAFLRWLRVVAITQIKGLGGDIDNEGVRGVEVTSAATVGSGQPLPAGSLCWWLSGSRLGRAGGSATEARAEAGAGGAVESKEGSEDGAAEGRGSGKGGEVAGGDSGTSVIRCIGEETVRHVLTELLVKSMASERAASTMTLEGYMCLQSLFIEVNNNIGTIDASHGVAQEEVKHLHGLPPAGQRGPKLVGRTIRVKLRPSFAHKYAMATIIKYRGSSSEYKIEWAAYRGEGNMPSGDFWSDLKSLDEWYLQ